ncbi:MAG: fasciclin domain-containing protein, partial [Bacteroidota bacterium]
VNNTFGGNGAGNFGDDVALFIDMGVTPENNTNAVFINNAFASDFGLGNVAIEFVEGTSGTPNIISGGGNFFAQDPVDITAGDDDIVNTNIDPLTLFTDFAPDDTENGNDLSINCDLADHPFVDAGVTVPADTIPTTDFAGNDRDDMPDIGAFEKVIELPSVVEIIVDSDDHNTLESLLGNAGLVDDLSGDGPFTVFAPTDAAFALLTSEQNDLLAIGDNLVNTLLTHVAAGATFSGDITDGMSVPSLAMNTNLDFGVDGATVTVSTPQSVVATVIMPDIEASNGVVHVIDMVLIPAIVAVSDIDGAGFDVEFFPNPVQDRMNVRINDLQIEDMNVSLINMAGQRLSNQVLTNGNNIIEFTTLPAGTYTLEINIDGNIYSKQVLKQ